MKVIIKELEQSADRVPEYQISDLIRKIKSHKRIFVYGTGRSGLMLKALAMRLMQIGLDAYRDFFSSGIDPGKNPDTGYHD